jgi:hypothetical protein
MGYHLGYISDPEPAKELFYNFPDMFAQAQKDWAKLKAGLAAGLFTQSQKNQAWDWFKEFPKAWETVRPNWSENISSVQRAWGQKVDAFVAEIKGYGGLSGLGLAPVVIAGILIVGGLAAASWGVGYLKKQLNVSKMIDEVTAGKLPASILEEATKEQPGLFEDIAGLIKWVVIGGVILMVVVPALGARSGR